MTTGDGFEAVAPRRQRVGVLSSVAIGLVAVVVTVVLGLVGRVNVASHSGLHRVTFGSPLGWLSQDQRGLDPSRFPTTVTVGSPWEHPTSVAILPLAIDLLVVYAVLMALLVGWRATRGRT